MHVQNPWTLGDSNLPLVFYEGWCYVATLICFLHARWRGGAGRWVLIGALLSRWLYETSIVFPQQQMAPNTMHFPAPGVLMLGAMLPISTILGPACMLYIAVCAVASAALPLISKIVIASHLYLLLHGITAVVGAKFLWILYPQVSTDRIFDVPVAHLCFESCFALSYLMGLAFAYRIVPAALNAILLAPALVLAYGAWQLLYAIFVTQLVVSHGVSASCALFVLFGLSLFMAWIEVYLPPIPFVAKPTPPKPGPQLPPLVRRPSNSPGSLGLTGIGALPQTPLMADAEAGRKRPSQDDEAGVNSPRSPRRRQNNGVSDDVFTSVAGIAGARVITSSASGAPKGSLPALLLAVALLFLLLSVTWTVDPRSVSATGPFQPVGDCHAVQITPRTFSTGVTLSKSYLCTGHVTNHTAFDFECFSRDPAADERRRLYGLDETPVVSKWQLPLRSQSTYSVCGTAHESLADFAAFVTAASLWALGVLWTCIYNLKPAAASLYGFAGAGKRKDE